MNFGLFQRGVKLTPASLLVGAVMLWPQLACGQAGNAGGAGGQLPQPQQPQQPQQQPGEESDGFTPRWAPAPQLPQFNGFPTAFPKGLGAFGSYPLSSGASGFPGLAGALSTGPGGLPVFALPIDEAPGWPRWLRAMDAPEFPYVPEQALLLRQSERVWWKEPGEDAFVPLYFHDKVRSAVPGTEVEVRQTGDFELLLHGGGRILSQGQTHLRIETMDEKHVILKFSTISKLRMQLSGREQQLHLPDGSVLTVPADLPPETPEEVPIGPAVLVIERASEPGEFFGRAMIWNGGQRPVHWRYALGECNLKPGQRMQFFLHPVPAAIGARLVASQADVAVRGAQRTCTANADGAVQCCGASFVLSKGARLELDPMQGDPLQDRPPDAASAR